MMFKNIYLLKEIIDNFKLNIDGDHGLNHWTRVYKNTQLLSTYYNINSDVFELFAILHDSKREDEFEDINHGKRAAKYIKQLIIDNKINLNYEDQRRLIYACSNHTKSNKKAKLYQDIIVQICFDSDRLDIGRVGIIPEEKYFNTDYAKKVVYENKYYL